MIHTPRSPFAARISDSGRLRGARSFTSWAVRRGVMFGNRRLRFPLLALQVSQDLGPCRHALSQRTIAGFMTVHFPPPSTPSPARWPASPGRLFPNEDPHA